MRKLLRNPGVWAALSVIVIGLPVAFFVIDGSGEPPPVLATLPAFTLTDQTGEPFGSEQLAGKVWVANFIFTRCPVICPAFTRKMVGVQEKTRGLRPLHLVSFSVDPEFDTPEVLAEYARGYQAEPGRWTFLTGEPETIKATVMEGLKVGMGRTGPADDVDSIFHGTKFVVVDGEGGIRGYYDSEDEAAIQRMLKDVARLTGHSLLPERKR
jgi:protein SCO1